MTPSSGHLWLSLPPECRPFFSFWTIIKAFHIVFFLSFHCAYHIFFSPLFHRVYCLKVIAITVLRRSSIQHDQPKILLHSSSVFLFVRRKTQASICLQYNVWQWWWDGKWPLMEGRDPYEAYNTSQRAPRGNPSSFTALEFLNQFPPLDSLWPRSIAIFGEERDEREEWDHLPETHGGARRNCAVSFWSDALPFCRMWHPGSLTACGGWILKRFTAWNCVSLTNLQTTLILRAHFQSNRLLLRPHLRLFASGTKGSHPSPLCSISAAQADNRNINFQWRLSKQHKTK